MQKDRKIIGQKTGGCGTMLCSSCNGKTGFLYIIEDNDGKVSEICTTCKVLATTDNPAIHKVSSYFNNKYGNHY